MFRKTSDYKVHVLLIFSSKDEKLGVLKATRWHEQREHENLFWQQFGKFRFQNPNYNLQTWRNDHCNFLAKQNVIFWKHNYSAYPFFAAQGPEVRGRPRRRARLHHAPREEAPPLRGLKGMRSSGKPHRDKRTDFWWIPGRIVLWSILCFQDVSAEFWRMSAEFRIFDSL